MRKKIDIDMAAFEKDAANGMNTATLAEKYGIGVSTVWRLKKNLAKVEPETDSDAVAIDEEPSEYELKVSVPTSQLDDMLTKLEEDELRSALGKLCAQDKANIVQIVLQQRLNDAVGA